MAFTKLGRYYLSLEDIVFVHGEGPEGRITVGFRGGGREVLQERESRAFRAWLADKVKEELPLTDRDEG